jgi:hypothetical protein
MGVGLELAGRRVRCPLCREVVTAPAAAAGPAPQPTTNRGPEGVESIFADPEESEDSIVGGTPTQRKPIPPSDTEVVPVTTPRPAPRTAVPFINKPPSSQRHPVAQPVTAEVPTPPAEEGSPFAGLGGDPPPAKPVSGKSKRNKRVERVPVPAWVWIVVATLAGYGMVMTAVAAWGWMR